MSILLIAFSVSLIAMVGLLKTNLVNIALDEPNHRSLHAFVTPRTGGLAIMFGILVALAFLGGLWLWFSFVVAFMLISLVDDIVGLQVRWRLLAQLLLCMFFIWILLPQFSWWMVLLVLFALVWMTNLYNFMDGSDGLAGGMALFGFGAYALASYMVGNVQVALMCGAIASSSLAFLLFNFHPAKIFMGDAGSIPLGFLAGAIGLYGWQHTLWPNCELNQA